MFELSRQLKHLAVLVGMLLSAAMAGGCSFGPRLLEGTHGQYNDALKQVVEEQALLNIVRARYHDSPMRLDVASIAAQYELNTGVEAQPFFGVNATNTVIGGVSTVLPFASLRGANRPTISMTPLDDPETIRNLYSPTKLDSIIFLSETSY